MDIEPRERSDLLKTKENGRKKDATETNGTLSYEEERGPPDGGLRAYAVLLGSFLTNGLLFGVINSYSVIFPVIESSLRNQTVPNASSRASLVGSLAMGTTFLLSPLSGVLTGLLGLRITAVLGGTIAAAGMFFSSFAVENVEALYFTYGIMYGIGASFAYTPSLAILGHYFKKHLGKVNGFVTIGSSIFTVIMPVLMDYMIVHHGLNWLFRLLAIFTFGIALCGLLFKPIPLMTIKKSSDRKGFKTFYSAIINVQIWKNKKYMIWAISMPVALFGYFVPYVLIGEYTKMNFPGANGKIPLQCIAIASGMGRLIFGWLADKPGIDRIMLQQISFYVIGVLTIILPFMDVFGLVIAISLGMGLFDGAFISLIGPIAFELCGGAYAAQAIGCMLGLAATPLSVGPPIASYLFDVTKSYTLPFVLAGISPLVGASLMFAVRYYRHAPNRAAARTNGVAAQPTAVCVERSASTSLIKKTEENEQAPL